MSDNIELLPCPFCGSTNLAKSPWIECDNCGAMGPSPRDCDNYPGGWNRRATLAQQPAHAVPAVHALLDSDSVPDDFRNQASGYRAGWNDCLAAAPAAPVAVQPLPYWAPCNPACDPELNGSRSKLCDCAQATAALAAPPAAEQPECGCCGQTGPCDMDCDCAEQPDTVAVPRDVLRACWESLADGLETVGSAEAEWSTKDRALVARIYALLAWCAE